ncbi:MAG: DNA methyltransferase [Thermodesulfobacteriota bacterium]|nr:DNA methyltransferase [Thermodesulfobacteriota bacterium]
MSEFDTKIPTIEKSEVNHLNRQIPPLAHTAMYNWHKFWSRKTWNVVGEFIKTYSKEGEIVFDPFAGSGVAAMEALKNKRRVIICDILPVATEIARLTIKPFSENELFNAFKRVESKAKNKILSLYKTRCRKCETSFPFTCSIWENNTMVEIRYQSCPHCGDRREKETPPTKEDLKLINDFENKKIKEWYPKNPLYYPDGQPFKEKQKYESIDGLFTRRNLQALAWLMEAIEEELNRDLRDFLKIGFTSIVHLATKMMPVGEPKPTNHYTYFSSPGWTQHSYWYADRFMEQEVWKLFESAINGHQGLIKAKIESNKYFQNIKFGNNYKEVFDRKADIYVHTGSALELMEGMPKSAVDYIFTDPPYDSSIQYGELAYLWIAWLKKDEGYLDYLISNEVIHNEKQHKDFGVYHGLLSRSFRDMFEILKPGRYLTVTFHNPTFKVRNATIRAGVFAGFEFQKIHHQPLGQVSAKAMMQPFGSAQGDFYLRFYRPKLYESVSQPEEIDEKRFEKIVVETTIGLLAERAEETPYTQIINFIDPVLAKNGYFSSLETGLDVKKVLEKHLGKEFILVDTKIGGAIGKLWWLKEPNRYIKYDIPLSERVEETVYRELLSKGKVTFTQVWDAISTKFPNSLTSDSSSIMDALIQYARKVHGGFWMLKPDYFARQSQHNEVLALLAEVGKSLGFKIWIGKKEQSEYADGLAGNKKLSEYVNANLDSITNAENKKTIQGIDLLWIKSNKIASSFEIEFSTSMTSALVRGSNIDSEVPKYLVIPEEREEQFKRKQKSPMFAEQFEKDNWNLLYFDSIRQLYKKLKSKQLELNSIINKKGPATMRPVIKNNEQMNLF